MGALLLVALPVGRADIPHVRRAWRPARTRRSSKRRTSAVQSTTSAQVDLQDVLRQCELKPSVSLGALSGR
eukprot:591548-Amphidinium_carterae.1